jgi:hypothetical protein
VVDADVPRSVAVIFEHAKKVRMDFRIKSGNDEMSGRSGIALNPLEGALD